ncbi:MAG: hypothetical protein AAB533_03435 [Patescibacteria group bacterium]
MRSAPNTDISIKPEYYSTVKTLTKAILVVIGVGVVVSMAVMAPNAIQILKPFLGSGKRKDHDRKRLRQALGSLCDQKLVESFRRKREVYLRLTKKGRASLKRLDIHALVLPQRVWDKKWRVVFFDIPEEKGSARRAFQQRLRTLGCMRLQKSIFVYPHACADEIDALTDFWGITPFVHYFETADLGTAQSAAEKFFRFS